MKCLARISWLLAAVALLAGTSVAAEVFRFDGNAGLPPLTLASETPAGIVVRYSMESFAMEPLVVDGRTLQTISLPGVILPNDPGAPNLPGLGRFVALPEGATASFTVLASRTQVYHDVAVAPAAPLPKETDDAPPVYAMDPAVYGRNADYPESPVRLSEVHQLRGVDAVVLGITPFQYNPVTRDLTVYTNLEVRVDFAGGTGRFGEDRLRSRYWEPILQDHLLNYASLPAVDPSRPRGGRTGFEYVIICPDNAPFIAWADTLKSWRTLQGVSTEVYTTTEVGGTTSAAIESFLNNAYNTWDPAPAAFLLLGDYPGSGLRDTGITAPIWNSYCVSDNIYADVNADNLPDMAHARLTARNEAELQIMINKMLTYERQPYTDPEFYRRPTIAGGWQTERWFILCCEVTYGFLANVLGKTPTREYAIYSGTPGSQWSTNQNTYMIVDYFGPNGLGYIPLTPQHLTDWGGNATRINADINAGTFMVYHRDHGAETGWGEPAYGNGDLNNLHNTEYPFVFSLNCLTGMYNWSSECFTEKFHRMGYGALGLVAASEVSYSFVNDTYAWGMTDALWPQFDPGYGRNTGEANLRTAFALASGKYYLQASSWPYNPGDKTVTYHLFHHHGDAFMTMYSEVPQALAVTHDDVCFTDTDVFAARAPLGSVIALTVNGQIVGVADATGLMQDIPIVPQSEPGELRVTVTKANCYRYDQRVPIIPPSGPYLVCGARTVDDDLSGDSAGNADAGCDAGETVELVLGLRNAGSETATNVRATLSTIDPNVQITDDFETYGDIAPGQEVACVEDFDFAILPTCPDNHTLAFTVTAVSDNRMVWEKNFALTVEAPVMGLIGYTINDAAGGDGDGRAEPGETFLLNPRLGNTGHEDATGLQLELHLAHPQIEILQGQSMLGTLPAGGEASPLMPFQLRIDPEFDDPNIVNGSISVSADWSQGADLALELPVGGFFDDMEDGPGAWTSYVVTAGFANQWHRSTTRNYTPGGAYSWKFGDTGAGSYANRADGALESEPVTLRETSFLRFRHWMQAEVSGAHAGYCYDGGMVEMSINGGSWQQIAPEGGYPYRIRTGSTPGPWPAETPVYSGSLNWVPAVFAVSDQTGQARFRFRFGSDGADVMEGWYIDEVEFIGSGVDPASAGEPVPLTLHPVVDQNRPNPFGPSTAIAFSLPEWSQVSLQVFDPSGRLVRTLARGPMDAGAHRVSWDGRADDGATASSGVYFYRFQVGDTVETRRMILTR
jgi:hypothetical protein